MRMFLITMFSLIACSLMTGCGEDPSGHAGASRATAELDAGVSFLADGGGLVDAGVLAAMSEKTDGSDKELGGFIEPGLLHEEGAARPPGIVRLEKEVSRPVFPIPVSEQMVRVSSGVLLAGSMPNDRLRLDYAENDMEPHEMSEFEIDVLPFPNDPSRPFLTGITRKEAEVRCRTQGKRLCTELEWEWACKSSDNRRYPIGNQYEDSAYPESNPSEPASPNGVFAMGLLFELTASQWGQEPDQIERIAVRGYSAAGGGSP